ncbi:hypothetical protein POTOM_030013 [Populus tomentosa]|uniref:Uncharacterized protein n=1 Tax=Populus tomentosa TaxID=118781 RepID=A0A8X8CK59_POPTO|nr:hypothetical protein POTOM_030013 [Populus tomentosa]
MGILLSCYPFFLMVISDQEKKRKKSGFMEEGTAGRSSERLESGLPPKLMEDFAPMEFEPIGCPMFHRIQVNSEGTLPSEF